MGRPVGVSRKERSSPWKGSVRCFRTRPKACVEQNQDEALQERVMVSVGLPTPVSGVQLPPLSVSRSSVHSSQALPPRQDSFKCPSSSPHSVNVSSLSPHLEKRAYLLRYLLYRPMSAYRLPNAMQRLTQCKEWEV